MKTILGIIASPRKLGNTEIMIKEISKHIDTPHELNLLRLSDFNILPCKGCYQCLFKEERCIQKDDFEKVLEAILNADALIVGVPTYFLGPNACLKRFLDRGLAFYAYSDKLWGKPSVGFGIAGIDGKEGSVLLGIENFLKMILSDIKMIDVIYGALPGEIFLTETAKHVAEKMGKALFKPAPNKKPYACPLCGGETFRFLSPQRVKCMLCSNTGDMIIEDGIPKMSIQRGEHELFLTQADTIQHGQWLRQMKERFNQHKNQLKEISMRYMDGGRWIKP